MSALDDVGFSTQRRNTSTRESISLPAFEYAILQGMIADKFEDEIAQELGVSYMEVQHGISSILKRFGVRTRTGAVTYAFQLATQGRPVTPTKETLGLQPSSFPRLWTQDTTPDPTLFNERQLRVLELLARGWSEGEISLFLGDRRIQGVWATISAIRSRLWNTGQKITRWGHDLSDLREYALKAKTGDTKLGRKLKEVGEQLGGVVRPVVGLKPESEVTLREVESSTPIDPAPIDPAQELAPQDSPTPPLPEAELLPEPRGNSAIHLEPSRVQRVRDLALDFRELFSRFPQPNFAIPSKDFGSWMNRYKAVLTKTKESLVGEAKSLEWRLSSPEGTALRERAEDTPRVEFSPAQQETWMKRYAAWHKEVKVSFDKVLAAATSNRDR